MMSGIKRPRATVVVPGCQFHGHGCSHGCGIAYDAMRQPSYGYSTMEKFDSEQQQQQQQQLQYTPTAFFPARPASLIRPSSPAASSIYSQDSDRRSSTSSFLSAGFAKTKVSNYYASITELVGPLSSMIQQDISLLNLTIAEYRVTGKSGAKARARKAARQLVRDLVAAEEARRLIAAAAEGVGRRKLGSREKNEVKTMLRIVEQEIEEDIRRVKA